MSEIRIVAPKNNSNAFDGVPYTIFFEQEATPPPIQGAVCTQFSSSASGPWTTSRPPGKGGAVECAPAQWSAQLTDGEVPGVLSHSAAWIRLGVWPDQALSGPPLFASDPIYRNVVQLGEP